MEEKDMVTVIRADERQPVPTIDEIERAVFSMADLLDVGVSTQITDAEKGDNACVHLMLHEFFQGRDLFGRGHLGLWVFARYSGTILSLEFHVRSVVEGAYVDLARQKARLALPNPAG